nr:RNA-processing protein, HAT helix [Ipomoea batatas]
MGLAYKPLHGYDWIYTAVVVNCTFSNEEFSKKIQELALRFQLSGDEYEDSDKEELNRKVFDPVKTPDWVEREEIIPAASIKWKANSVDLLFSLRIIKRKKQWAEGFHEEGELASCSMKRAFSNMVLTNIHGVTTMFRMHGGLGMIEVSRTVNPQKLMKKLGKKLAIVWFRSSLEILLPTSSCRLPLTRINPTAD